MLNPVYSSQFKRDIRKVQLRGYNINLLKDIMTLPLQEAPLSPSNLDHSLKGKWKNFRELHIQADWLLIYKIFDNDCIFVRTGTHADLFSR